MGMTNMDTLVEAGENIVAVCDVDYPYVERQLAGRLRPQQGQTAPSPESLRLQDAYTTATKYDDFRVMLEQAEGHRRRRHRDAGSPACRDRADTAMKAGKHVYVQKPLTYTVHEARMLAQAARDTKVVTQMGNQGHSRWTARGASTSSSPLE